MQIRILDLICQTFFVCYDALHQDISRSPDLWPDLQAHHCLAKVGSKNEIWIFPAKSFQFKIQEE